MNTVAGVDLILPLDTAVWTPLILWSRFFPQVRHATDQATHKCHSVAPWWSKSHCQKLKLSNVLFSCVSLQSFLMQFPTVRNTSIRNMQILEVLLIGFLEILHWQVEIKTRNTTRLFRKICVYFPVWNTRWWHTNYAHWCFSTHCLISQKKHGCPSKSGCY